MIEFDLKDKPRILIISRWTQMPKGFSRIMDDLYSTGIWQKDFNIIHYAWHRPISMLPEIENNNIATISAVNDNKLLNTIEVIKPSIILIMGDPDHILKYKNILETYNGIKIAYLFLDGFNIPLKWRIALRSFDIIVSATEFGKEEFLKDKFEQRINFNNPIRVINPPVNTEEFFPIDSISRDKLRKSYGFTENDFVMSYICINSVRKGVEMSVELLSRLYKDLNDNKININPKLILHTDVDTGFTNASRNFNLPEKSLFLSAGKKSLKDIKNIYRISDLNINTSLAEGWGLPLTEAMACGTPVLAPNHSGIVGAVGAEENNSIKYKFKENFLYDCLPHTEYLWNTEDIIFVKRPNISSAIKKIKKYLVKDRKNYSENMKQLALERIKFINKSVIANKWLEIFKECLEYQKNNRDLNILNTPKTIFYKF